MSNIKIQEIALANSYLSLDVQKMAINLFFGELKFDTVSFPNLTTTILFNDKKHPLENYILYEIDELIYMHKTKRIIAFVSRINGYPEQIEWGLKKRYPELDIDIIKYKLNGNLIELTLERDNGQIENKTMRHELNTIVIMPCADGRLIDILIKIEQNNFRSNLNYHHVCFPGSTTWMTMSPVGKLMKNYFIEYLDKYLISNILIIHHGKDCGRFLQYHDLKNKNIDAIKALEQHKKNIELSWKKLKRMRYHLNIMAIYYEFNLKENTLGEYIFNLNSHNQLVQVNYKEYPFDFEKYQFI